MVSLRRACRVIEGGTNPLWEVEGAMVMTIAMDGFVVRSGKVGPRPC